MRGIAIAATILVATLAGCAGPEPQRPCPDLTGAYVNAPVSRNRAGEDDDLTHIFFDQEGKAAPRVVHLDMQGQQLSVSAGSARRTLAQGSDFTCSDDGLRLVAPVVSGVDVAGVVTDQTETHYTFRRQADGALVASTTERRHVKFIAPAVTGPTRPGASLSWQQVDASRNRRAN